MSKSMIGQPRYQPSEARRLEMEFNDAQPARFSCAFCGWHFEGPVSKARSKALAHREKKHPETIGLTRRRRRGGSQLTTFRYAPMDQESVNEIETERRKRAYLNGVEIVE